MRSVAAFAILATALAGAVVAGLCLGSSGRSPARILALLVGDGTPFEIDALLHVRLPRVLVGAGAGAALAVAGALLQCVTRNPLADSGLLGINAGGGLAMVALLTAYPERGAVPPGLVPVAAAGGGLAAAAAVLALSWRRGGIAPIRLLLVGIAVSATAGAGMLALSLGLDTDLLRFVVAWQAGTLSGRDAAAAWLALPVAGAGLAAAWVLAPRLDLLRLGDDAAAGLGGRVDAMRSLAVAIAAVLAAAAVTVAGSLGFVGLIAPAIARTLLGGGLRRLAPAAALAGAAVVVAADAAARTVATPIELPTGILVALLGGPLLLVTLVTWSRP